MGATSGTGTAYPSGWPTFCSEVCVTRSLVLYGGAGAANPSSGHKFTTGFSGVYVTQSLVFYVIFCRSSFVILFFFLWLLYCLSFDWRIMNPLVFKTFLIKIRCLLAYFHFIHLALYFYLSTTFFKPVLRCHLWDKKVPYKTDDLLKEFQFIWKSVVFSGYSCLLHDITEILLKVALKHHNPNTDLYFELWPMVFNAT
jgi:hypothetical protein